jgi:penicillin-binding protein 1A
MGYDKPRHLGRGQTGGHTAAPIVKDFMRVALADTPAQPFRVPPGIKLIRINSKTGLRAGPSDAKVILEAFKPGTAPPDSYSVIGLEDETVNPYGGSISPDAQRQIGRGPHGLW